MFLRVCQTSQIHSQLKKIVSISINLLTVDLNTDSPIEKLLREEKYIGFSYTYEYQQCVSVSTSCIVYTYTSEELEMESLLEEKIGQS